MISLIFLKIIDRKKTISQFLQIFLIPECEVFILEGPETRAITSRYSATGKTTKFLFSCLVDEDTEPHIISTFKDDLKNRLLPGSSYKLLSTTYNQYGYELKTDSIVSIFIRV